MLALYLRKREYLVGWSDANLLCLDLLCGGFLLLPSARDGAESGEEVGASSPSSTLDATVVCVGLEVEITLRGGHRILHHPGLALGRRCESRLGKGRRSRLSRMRGEGEGSVGGDGGGGVLSDDKSN
jgi:hypothetical protein